MGTPWADHGRFKGDGVDCIGFVVEVLKAVGFMPDFVYPQYKSMAKDDGEIEGYVNQWLTEIPLAAIAPGDVVITRAHHIALPTHLAFIGDYRHGGPDVPLSIIHSALGLGRVKRQGLRGVPLGAVVEHVLDETWRGHLIRAYSVPGAV